MIWLTTLYQEDIILSAITVGRETPESGLDAGKQNLFYVNKTLWSSWQPQIFPSDLQFPIWMFSSLSSNLNSIYIESGMTDISWRDITQIFKFCLRIFLQHKKFDASEIFYTKITSSSIRENLILQRGFKNFPSRLLLNQV